MLRIFTSYWFVHEFMLAIAHAFELRRQRVWDNTLTNSPLEQTSLIFVASCSFFSRFSYSDMSTLNQPMVIIVWLLCTIFVFGYYTYELCLSHTFFIPQCLPINWSVFITLSFSLWLGCFTWTPVPFLSFFQIFDLDLHCIVYSGDVSLTRLSKPFWRVSWSEYTPKKLYQYQQLSSLHGPCGLSNAQVSSCLLCLERWWAVPPGGCLPRRWAFSARSLPCIHTM